MNEPCKHGHIDGAMHKPCYQCRCEHLEAEIAAGINIRQSLSHTISRLEAELKQTNVNVAYWENLWNADTERLQAELKQALINYEEMEKSWKGALEEIKAFGRRAIKAESTIDAVRGLSDKARCTAIPDEGDHGTMKITYVVRKDELDKVLNINKENDRVKP